MAGQTVGGPDATGMRQAQNTDSTAKKAMDVAKQATAKVSGWREERGVKKELKKERRLREAQRRLDEAEALKERQDATPAVDEQATEGAPLTEFNKVFLDAIRRGQSRTEQASSADSIIREVVCNETFIRAIANGAVRTPLEQMDTEYGKEMAGRRAKLAQTLTKAREQKEFMIGNLESHEVDIIYATMLGTAEEDAITKTPGAVELWRNTPWPNDLPKPPDAFFLFLESVAIRQQPDEKGKFIGNVLKGLTIRKTFVDTTDTTLRTLVDGALINDYLYTTSSYPIDTAVEGFHSTVVNLLRTPTGQKDSVLDMPGLGYDEGYAQALAEKKVWVEQARQIVTQSDASLETAVQTHKNAQTAVTAAQKEVNKAVAFGKKVEKQGSIRLEGGAVWAKDGPEIKAALETTAAALRQAEGELGKAATWLDAAKAAKAKSERELKRRAGEVSKFEAEANPQAFAKELANHFKSLLEENRDSHVKFSEVAERMEARLPNIAITKLITRAENLVEMMEDTKQHFNPDMVAERALLDNLTDERRTQLVALATKDNPEAAALLMKDIKKTTGAEKETETFAFKEKRFADEMGKLAQEIEDAQTPEEVKVRLRATQKCMASLRYPKDTVTAQLGAIGKEYAFPLGKAVKHAVRDLEERSYRNLAGITDAEKIIARMAYEARTGELKGLPGSRESKWTWFWQQVSYHLFTAESWVGRDRRSPGKLVWLYRKTIAQDIEGLHPRNWGDHIPGRKPDKTPYARKRWYQMRIFDSLWGITWKGYIAGGALFGALITTQPLEHGYQYLYPWHWPNLIGRPVTMLAESISGGPIYVPESQNHIYYPWSWFMPTEGERQIKRVIHDNYDIPERLASRGAGYYRQSYGVGTHKLPTETTDDGMRARLEWLEGHSDVLRFLQERTTLRMDVRTKVLGERPENCSNSQMPVPNTCKALGLSTPDLIQAYRPVDTNDGWQPGMRVCCTIEVTSRRVPDGLKLNTYTSDAFVDLLMAVERGGGSVNYAYLTNAGNRGRWAQEWYLVTPSEADIISGFKITERDNVRFLLMQGAEASALLLPRCASEPRSPEFLREEQRNAFASAWRAEVVRVLAGTQPAPQPVAPVPTVSGSASAGPAPTAAPSAAPSAAPTAAPSAAPVMPAPVTVPITDPLTQDVPANVLEQTFKTVRDQHTDWFMDRTHAYERAQAAQQVPELSVQTETALDVLVAQSDVLDLLKQFGSRAAYSVNTGRSDEFIQVLDQHKRMGGSLDDFNPFSTASGAGSRVQWAVQMGYLASTETFNAEGSQAREGADGGTAAPGASARPAGPAPLPDLTQDAQRFYTNPANEAFTSFFEGVMRGMFTDRGTDGRAFQGVLTARFNNDQTRMERAIKGDMFRFLGSTSPVDAAARDGITVTGSGASMTAVPRDMAKSRNSLRNHMRQAAMAWGR